MWAGNVDRWLFGPVVKGLWMWFGSRAGPVGLLVRYRGVKFWFGGDGRLVRWWR